MSSQRSALIDSAKGLACAAIVWHHLAFYGPMPGVVHTVLPGVIDGLIDYARMAVQVFLVLGGYLAAASLAPQGRARLEQPWMRIVRRFMRLVVPYAVALVVVMLVSDVIRPWFHDPALSPEPSFWQLLAHALLLQGVVGQESLSAGVWYVAIDFQLYAFTVLLFWAAWKGAAWLRRYCGGLPGGLTVAQVLVALLAALSLLHFNRDAGWDNWAVYFFGAYALGMMAWWAVHAPRRTLAWGWLLCMALLLLLALALQWRARIALAGCTAFALVLGARYWPRSAWGGWSPLLRLGQMSYSVFLVHFAACLLVNAVVHWFWPDNLAAALAGMPLAFGLSLWAGGVLYVHVERHVPTWRVMLRWEAAMIGAGLVAARVALA